MVTARFCSKLKTSWKSVAFTNKVGKNSRYFVGVLIKNNYSCRACWLLDDYSVYPTWTCGIILNYLYWLLNFATLPLWNSFAKGFIIPRGLHVASETIAKRKQAISNFAAIFFLEITNKNKKKIVTHSATHIPPKIFAGRPSLHNQPASRGGWASGLKE